MRVLVFVLALWSGAAAAHAVHHDIVATGAVSVALTYADGSPFAYEKYELYPDGKEVPVQVGNTDAAGHVVFLPGDTKQWRLKAFSSDGHGVDMRFESPAVLGNTAAAESGPSRTTLALLGLGLILAAFGAYQLFLGRMTK
ncbi:MAG: ABC transporter permease [Rhodocyclaceae bacterium]|nr:ABC transporter permease [Rhodocyclaceae bacterium]